MMAPKGEEGLEREVHVDGIHLERNLNIWGVLWTNQA